MGGRLREVTVGVAWEKGVRGKPSPRESAGAYTFQIRKAREFTTEIAVKGPEQHQTTLPIHGHYCRLCNVLVMQR